MHIDKKFSFSVIIPTLNRPRETEQAILSVLQQTFKPIEIVIVDQSDNELTKNICKKIRTTLLESNIELVYFFSEKNGLTLARNIGIDLARGDYLTFIDSDVVLNKDYLYEVNEIIKLKDAVLVQGIILNYKEQYNLIKYCIRNLFFRGSISKSDGSVYASFCNSLPVSFSVPIKCMWVSGCNHTVLAQIAQEEKYDEKLILYAVCEDVDFSYRIQKKYPNQVWATPKAKLQHLESPEARIANKKLIYMEAVHRYYLYRKNIRSNLINSLIFLWSRIGKVVFDFIKLFNIKRALRVNYISFSLSVQSELFVLKHRKDIRRHDLDFFYNWFSKN